MRRLVLSFLVAWGGAWGGACGGGSSAPDLPSPEDRQEPTLPREDASDGARDAAPSPRDAGTDAQPGPVASWARYTIAPGAHGALLMTSGAGDPMSGFASGVSGRDYDLAFDSSAIYTITKLVEPNDQLDWNKLPGLSDCGTIDLAADGAMFGWRWRLDTTPNVLEITAYANDAGKHTTPTAPMVTLDAADLASVTPLRYRLWMDGSLYRFAIAGVIRGRTIDAAVTLGRRCGSTAPSSLPVQWAAGFYFGGTSTAPTTITSRIFERPSL